MKNATIPVLIIGAGPTGLMAAAQLQRFGIAHRIIEKRKGTTQFSKALGVQARTLEIYEQMGIIDQVLPLGLPAKELQIMVKGQEVQQMPLSTVGASFTAFPYLFVLEQSRNEELLYQYLQDKGGQVEWETSMVDFKVENNQAHVLVQKADGTQESIVANWIIAADGGRSPVRHALKIPFKGDTYQNVFYVVDTELKWDKNHQKLYMNLADNNFTAFFPITDERGTRFRLVGILPDQYNDVPQEDISFEDIQQNIQELQQLDLEFGETYWFSVYKIHHRCIDRFREGPVFFAGDAAHVHSPAGGQGMNTGLQDAYNLAWKLALVIQEKSPESLLDSYHKERWSVANRLVNTTDRVFTSIVKRGTLINWFRLKVMPFLASRLMGIPTIQKRAFRIVSQTGISYTKSPISQQNIVLPDQAPKAGERLPYLTVYNEQFQQQQNLYHRLGEAMFHLIVWQCQQDIDLAPSTQKIKQYLTQQYPNLFQTHLIVEQHQNFSTFQQLQLQQSALFVVRPDNYIAYIGAVDDLDGLQGYLGTLFYKD